jgi:iron complex outermembrane receptor protein
MKSRRPIADYVRKRLALSALSLAALGSPYASANHPVQFFDIPEQSTSDALNTFSKQSGLRLLFAFDEVAGRRVQAVRGNFSAEDVLTRLLEGSGLVYEITPDSVVLVRDPDEPAGRTSQRAAAGAPILLAQADVPAMRLAQAGGASEESAAEADSDSGELEEIIVTAQKRMESALEVPISLSVFGEAELAALRVQSVEDFAFNVPNLTYTNFGTFEGPDISIRGISQFGGSRFDPLGVSVDGVTFGATDSSPILTSRFFDYQQVEVLRGPQGTLSGRGAMGGSLNIVSVQPDTGAFEAKGILDVSRFSTTLAKGIVNVPVGDRFAFRAVGYREDTDGAIRNTGPAGDDLGYENHGGRIAARWLPSERMTVDLAVGYEELTNGYDSEMPVDVYFSEETRQDRIDLLASLGGNYFDTQFFTDGGAGNDGGTVSMDVINNAEVEHLLISMKAAYELPEHTLSFLFGRFERDGSSLYDLDRSAYARFRNFSYGQSEASSYELRAASSYSGRLNWVAGVSYLDERNELSGATDYGDELYGGSYPDELLAQFPTSSLIDIESWGVYANAFWDFTEKLHLSAGVRWSHDDTGWGNTASLAPMTAADVTRTTLDSFDPRVALNYDFASNATAYFQYATGYRSGFGNPAVAVDLGLAPPVVGEERLKNYELGVKGRFLDNRMQVTADVFFMDYSDLQVGGYTYVDEQFIYFSANAGEASARGFEVEVDARPNDRWRLSAAVGYVDSELADDTLIQWFGEDVEDPTIPNTKPWTVSATAAYMRPITPSLKGGFRIDHRRQSHSYEDFAQNLADMNPAFQVTDISLDLEAERWSLSAYFENVSDTTYWLANSTGSSLHGTFVAFIPRTYGLRFTANLKSPRN